MSNVLVTDTGSDYTYYFASFPTYKDFFDYSQKLIADVGTDYRPTGSKYGLTQSQLNAGEYIEYMDQKALRAAMVGFDKTYASIDMGGAFEKQRLKFTENPRGIFDFSLASSGLYKVQEFFSEKLSIDSPLEFPNELPGIVPPDFVTKNQMGDYWYKSQNDDKYQMIKQDKGQRAIDLDLPNAKYEYRTNNKKVYIEFPRKGGKSRKVDLYVPISAAWGIEASGMLARVLPMMVAAKYFEGIGIRTRINAIRLYRTMGSVVGVSWGIKDYGDDLDFNQIAIQCSDPRFFRWNMWRFISAMIRKNNWNADYAGNPMDYGALMISSQNRYKNWYKEQVDLGNLPDLGIHRNLMIFNSLVSTPNRWKFNANNYQNDSVYQDVLDRFNEILDIVDCQFNKPIKFVNRIAKRFEEEDKITNKDRLREMVRRYCVRVLERAFSYPKRGMYAADAAFKKENDSEYLEKINGVTDAINRI